MTAFDISPDGKLVVYTSQASNRTTDLWLAPLDHSAPATKVNIAGARDPQFGAHGQIIFAHTEGSENYLEQMNSDGTQISKVFPYPITDLQGVSPGRRWATVGVSRTSEDNTPAVLEVPLYGGGIPRHVCVTYCQPRWSTDGRFFFVPVEEPSRTTPGRSLAIPVGPGEALPELPAQGIPPMAPASAIKGAQSVGRAGLVPGTGPDDYVWVNTTIHRNLYRITLP